MDALPGSLPLPEHRESPCVTASSCWAEGVPLAAGGDAVRGEDDRAGLRVRLRGRRDVFVTCSAEDLLVHRRLRGGQRTGSTSKASSCGRAREARRLAGASGAGAAARAQGHARGGGPPPLGSLKLAPTDPNCGGQGHGNGGVGPHRLDAESGSRRRNRKGCRAAAAARETGRADDEPRREKRSEHFRSALDHQARQAAAAHGLERDERHPPTLAPLDDTSTPRASSARRRGASSRQASTSTGHRAPAVPASREPAGARSCESSTTRVKGRRARSSRSPLNADEHGVVQPGAARACRRCAGLVIHSRPRRRCHRRGWWRP